MPDMPLKFAYKSLDGSMHEVFVQPLKRNEGVFVLHTLLAKLASSLDMTMLGELTPTNLGPIVDFVARVFKNLEYDVFWQIATKLLRYSTIDNKECKDLESFDGFNGRFTDLYIVVFNALKVNYPDFFGLMGRGGSTESTDQAK
jgi:hypothetical protein